MCSLVCVCVYHNHNAGKVMVNDEMGFELVTELNVEDPQFTLTCISTGGPATTVTWTRDSEEAPGDRLSVLDNATSAQYTHTLNVTGKLGGLYTCSVSNSIPSEDSTDQLLEGKQICVQKTDCSIADIFCNVQLPQLPLT